MTVSQTPTHADPDSFIARWAPSGGQESANYQLFLTELCDLLGLDHPDPAIEETRENAYVFERRVEFDNGDGTRSSGWIDLYKRGCFVLEAKQSAKPQRQRLVARQGSRAAGTARRGGRGWDDAMRNAFGQARSYVHVLPPEEGSPPFLLVVDVAHVIDLYADFSGTGKAYSPFPDAQSNRIRLEDLRDPQTRETLRAVWQRPYDLDPTRESARVTKEVARRLADLARGLEKAGHGAEQTADFLMRCLFTLFAEDVELLPKDSVTQLLKGLRGEPHKFKPMVEDLWRAMNAGGFSVAIQEQVRQFNGTLFEQAHALPLDDDQLELMIQAAEANWRDVEPAIFGSLFEGALDKRQRHELGAHFTPRAYVERLVMPTVIEPLREEWADAQTASATQRERGDHKQAVEEIRAFHRRLCRTRVLDPACGSGNFLYVTMEHMKRLEAEVLEALYELDPPQYRMEMEGYTVQPEQFLGIEINPRAASIARLVIWIGYLQWHLRTRSGAPGEPILRHAAQIEYRDAILDYDRTEIARDDAGNPITHWDGETYKTSPTTGEPIPDETARVEVLKYINPRPAKWPEADYVVGNPPFIGVRRAKETLGRGYIETLRETSSSVSETADLVMYWWHKAGLLLKAGKIRRFGLITTKSITQDYSRSVLEEFINGAKPEIKIFFAVTNHPWVDTADGAAVRVAMTAAARQQEQTVNRILEVSDDTAQPKLKEYIVDRINSRLRNIPDFSKLSVLKSNTGICFQGVVPGNDGFKLHPEHDSSFLRKLSDQENSTIKPYMIGKDITEYPKQKYIIDAFGISRDTLMKNYPNIYQKLYDTVFPERQHNPRKSYRDRWWVFAEPRPALREAKKDLKTFIATPNTSKYRIFSKVDASYLPDAMAYAIMLNDQIYLAILSSRIHVIWCLAGGGKLEDRPRYNSKNTFAPFPFPDPSDDSLKQRIRELGEQLDRHRKERQAQHPGLTMTGMYNVLEKLRAGTPLTEKEKTIHEQGLVSVLRDIHDRLDAAVFDAYGWPRDLSDEQILERLVALNRERAAEEAKGHVRWLRPDFQAPEAARPKPKQESFEIAPAEPAAAPAAAPAAQAAWPKDMATQVATLRRTLERQPGPVSARALARQFKHARQDRVRQILDSLVVLGHARQVDEDRYAA